MTSVEAKVERCHGGSSIKGLVFSIEEFSTFNGPGIRTTVFLKGCPLRCKWCHNPEGLTLENEIIRSPNGCVHCGNCVKYGKDGKYTDESISHCPNGLLRHSAREYSPEGLYEALSPNLDILNSTGGGVTFSGGEPTFQYDFLLSCLRQLRGKTSRALQTCGYCEERRFSTLLKEIDYVLFDMKLADESEHIRFTGCGNALILQNLDAACASGIPFVVRVPLVPGVTDTEHNIAGICRILKSLGIDSVELLPYNKMSGSKYKMLGAVYAPGFDENAEPRTHLALFKEWRIRAVVK